MLPITSWLSYGNSITSGELKGSGADKVRARRAVNEFCSWATAQSVEFPLPAAQRNATLAEYVKTLEGSRNVNGELNKNGAAAEAWASELMARSVRSTESTEPITGAIEPPEEDDMAKQQQEPDDDEFDDGEEVDEEDGEFEDDDEPEPAPKRRAASRVVVVERPARRAAPPRRASAKEPRVNKVDKLFAQNVKVRILKRLPTGKVDHIDDYEAEDFGTHGLTEFIEEIVHPLNGNDAPFTDYVAYQLKSDGTPRGQPIEHRVEAEEAPEAGPPNAFNQVRQAFDFVKELQGPQEAPRKDETFALAKRQAVASGDMSQMLMLMMLEKTMAPQKTTTDADLVRMVLEKLGHSQQQPALLQPPQIPPWMMQPPAPPPNHAADKVLDLAIAQMVKPPPSIFEQAQQMATVRELFGGGKETSEVTQLKQEVAQLRGLLSGGGKEKDGFGSAMENFERVTTMVKSFAPQVVGESATSGFGSFVKSFLTPEVGKAIAGAIAGAPNAPGVPGPGGAPQQPGPQQPVVQTAPPPRDPNRPPNPMPPIVIEASKAFMAAQTPPFRAEKFADLVFAMFTTGDVYFKGLLEPIMADLAKPVVGVEELKSARRQAMIWVAEHNKDWALPEFVDSCIAALASKAGMPVPEALTNTRGAWTLDFRGTVLMLGDVAKEVLVTPQANPVAAADVSAGVNPAAAQLHAGPPPNFPTPIPAAEPLSVAPPERVKRAIELEAETGGDIIEPPRTPEAVVVAGATQPAEVTQFAPRR